MADTTTTAVGGAVVLGTIAVTLGLLAGADDTESIPIVQPATPAIGIKAGLRYGIIPTNQCTEELIAELCRSRPGACTLSPSTCATQRRSLDGKWMIVKWRGDPPKTVAALLVPEKTWAADTAPASEDRGWAFGAVDKVTSHEAWAAKAEAEPVEVEPR